MASPRRAVAPVSADVARKTWRTVEPLHGMIYFAAEATDSYVKLGLRPESGYFASRSAPMGAVTAETVVATFFNFSPELVHRAMDGVWGTAPPDAVLAARRDAADAALRRMLPDAIGAPEMARAAELAREAALRASEQCEGRPLFAGHVGLDWPDQPHLVLWHAQTLLREHRGDGHVALLVTHGLGPVEAMVMHMASGEVPPAFLRDTRGWPSSAWREATEALRTRGWLAGSTGDEAPALSDEGRSVRQEIEDATDRLAVLPYGAIGEDGCAELRRLARPFSREVVARAGFGA